MPELPCIKCVAYRIKACKDCPHFTGSYPAAKNLIPMQTEPKKVLVIKYRAIKRCPKCGIVKPIQDFPRNKKRPDGHAGHCKVCSTRPPEYYRKYRKQANKNPKAEFIEQ